MGQFFFEDLSFEGTKLKFPKAVAFIIVNEACERFTYYGLRTVLTIYFVQVLLYSVDEATVMYHFFVMLCYFAPLFGAIIADSWIGRFKTIMYLSIVYATGSVVLAVISANYGKPTGSNPAQIPITILGLCLIAIGTGGIKPCVSSFGGDQFKLPEQNLQLDRFFSIFYFAINFGSLISTFLTPIFRQNVKCFGDDSCYPLAFGVPAIFMTVALVIFVAGKPFYIIKPPMGNMCVHVTRCISSAIWNRRKMKKTEPRDRWIDYANNEKYDKDLRDDITYILKLLLLFLPLPVFWALFDQQGSRWTVQASRMDGTMGSLGTIIPDQMQVVNPILVLILLPLMQLAVYPLLDRVGLLRRPLKRITVGGVIAASSFFISAVLEWQIDEHPVASGQIKLFNLAPCGLRLESDEFDTEVGLSQLAMNPQLARAPNKGSFKVIASGSCVSVTELLLSTGSGDGQSIYLYQQNGNLTSSESPPASSPTPTPDSAKSKSKSKSCPTLRLVYVFQDKDRHAIDVKSGGDGVEMMVTADGGLGSSHQKEVPVGDYFVTVDSKVVASGLRLNRFTDYTLLINEHNARLIRDEFNLPLTTVHILWQLPQYFTLSLAEVMISVTGLEFSFTQASPKMKSVLSSIWLLAVAFGDILDLTVVHSKFIPSQFWEYMMFACLMLVVMVVFAIIAMRYTYRENTVTAGEDIYEIWYRKKKEKREAERNEGKGKGARK